MAAEEDADDIATSGSGPADAVAAAVAIDAGKNGPALVADARSYFREQTSLAREQTELARLQKENLREEIGLRRWMLRFEKSAAMGSWLASHDNLLLKLGGDAETMQVYRAGLTNFSQQSANDQARFHLLMAARMLSGEFMFHQRNAGAFGSAGGRCREKSRTWAMASASNSSRASGFTVVPSAVDPCR
jgi:hypothetical protein